MATKAEVRNRAAENLGILPVGQTLASEHQTRIDAAYDEVYDDLKVDGLATWAEANEVPDELVPYVATLVAFTCTETYPISPARYNRVVNKAATAKREIRRIITPKYESLENATDY